MHVADQIGLADVIARIEAYALEDGYFWQVPEILRDMVAQGQNFADMNAAEVTS